MAKETMCVCVYVFPPTIKEILHVIEQILIKLCKTKLNFKTYNLGNKHVSASSG